MTLCVRSDKEGVLSKIVRSNNILILFCRSWNVYDPRSKDMNWSGHHLKGHKFRNETCRFEKTCLVDLKSLKYVLSCWRQYRILYDNVSSLAPIGMDETAGPTSSNLVSTGLLLICYKHCCRVTQYWPLENKKTPPLSTNSSLPVWLFAAGNRPLVSCRFQL